MTATTSPGLSSLPRPIPTWSARLSPWPLPTLYPLALLKQVMFTFILEVVVGNAPQRDLIRGIPHMKGPPWRDYMWGHIKNMARLGIAYPTVVND